MLYASTMKFVLAKIILDIASENGLELTMGDIVNTYLNSETQRKI